MEANENYKEINVEDSRKDPASLLYYYKKLIALRKEHDVLIYGASAFWMKNIHRFLLMNGVWMEERS